MTESLAAIRDRRKVTVEQAGTMLTLAASADTESKRSLLSAASRALPDPAILARWIAFADTETDTEIREAMLARILRYDHRQIPDPAPYTGLLVWGLSRDDLRIQAIAALGALATGRPEVVDLLSRAYHGQRTAAAKRMILLALCQADTLPPPLAAFLLSVSDGVDADVKVTMARLLLRADAIPRATIAGWLTAPGPAELRRMLLAYALDRSLPLEDAFRQVLVNDDDPACRLGAVRALALIAPGSSETIRAILGAGQKDPSAEVREACMDCFRYGFPLSPEVRLALLDRLGTETSRQNGLLILDLLGPYLGSSPDMQNGLLALFAGNLHTEVAAAICGAMGKLAAWDPAAFAWLVDAYRTSADDNVRARIMESLSTYSEPSEQLAGLYREAVAAPDPRLKRWGVRGLLMLPLTPGHAGSVAAGARILLDPALDRASRHAIARKIARIADLPPDIRAVLKNVAEQSDDEDLKTICRQAVDRPVEQQPPDAIDFDHWFYRAEVDHTFDGIFPEIYAVFDGFPEQCRRILKAALLDPANSDSLYRNHVPDGQILRFLQSRDAIDDDICRYCAAWILSKDDSWGNPGPMLAILRSRPSFPGLADTLWQLFLRERDVEKCNPVLLRLTLAAAYGSDTRAGEEFRQRLFRQRNSGTAAPYFRFLMKNLLWPPAVPLLREALQTPAILDDELRAGIADALEDVGVPGPGEDEGGGPATGAGADPGKNGRTGKPGPGVVDD